MKNTSQVRVNDWSAERKRGAQRDMVTRKQVRGQLSFASISQCSRSTDNIVVRDPIDLTSAATHVFPSRRQPNIHRRRNATPAAQRAARRRLTSPRRQPSEAAPLPPWIKRRWGGEASHRIGDVRSRSRCGSAGPKGASETGDNASRGYPSHHLPLLSPRVNFLPGRVNHDHNASPSLCSLFGGWKDNTVEKTIRFLLLSSHLSRAS